MAALTKRPGFPRQTCIGLLAAAAVLACATPAAAQGRKERAAYREINERVPAPSIEAIQDSALKRVQDEMRERGGQCVPSGIEIGPLAPITADRAVFLGIGNGDLTNAFSAPAVQQGCGDAAPPVVLNIFGFPSGEWKVGFGVIGQTNAWFSLIRDAQETVVISAYLKLHGLDPNCKAPLRMELFELTDTRKAGPMVYGVRYKGKWSEVWRFSACGYDLAVPIEFKADGKGGAHFSVSAGDVSATKRP